MTTTNPTAPGIYEALETLPDVIPDSAMLAVVEELTTAGQQLYPILARAKELLAGHEQASEDIVSRLRDRVPLDTGIGDQTYELLDILSGARDLNVALSTLRDLCDPDNAMPNPELIQWAKDRMGRNVGEEDAR